MSEVHAETLPPPAPPSPTPLRPPQRWARSDERVLLGVAGGLARAVAVDPLIVRGAFVLLTLFGGVGIGLYVAALLMLADSPSADAPWVPRRIAGAAIGALSAWALLDGQAGLPSAPWAVAVALFGMALAMWGGREDSSDRPPPVIEDPTPLATATTWVATSPTRRREHSSLGSLALGAAAIVGAVVWLANPGAAARGAYAFGSATIVLGAATLVSAVFGRARWLALPALLTASAAVLGSAVGFAGVRISGHHGDRYEVPVGRPEALYRIGVGRQEIWLSDIRGDATTRVEVGVGEVVIYVPTEATVKVDARVGLGQIDAFGIRRSGFREELAHQDGSGSQRLDLTLRVGAGSITVRRTSDAKAGPLVPPTLVVGEPPPITIAADVEVVRTFADGTTLWSDGSITFIDGARIEPDMTTQIPIVAQREDGSVQLANGAIIYPDGAVTSPEGFVVTDASPPGSTTTTFAPMEEQP